MISIIIPLYNKEKFIIKTIQSLLAQTNKDWECIIVDDGSTDHSAELIKSINNPNIHYIKKENGGVSSARNLGVKHSQGEYILYLDADDVLLPDCIEIIQNTINRYKNFDIYTGNFYIERNHQKTLFLKRGKVGAVENGMKLLFKHKMYMRPGAYVIKREKAEEITFNEDLSRFEDLEIQLRYIKFCNIYVFKEALMLYQYDGNGLSLKVDKYQKDFLSKLQIEQTSKFWERQLIYNCMYIAIRNYSISLVRHYYKYMPQIVFSKILSIIMG